MDQQFIIVNSITYAIKCRDILFQHQIQAYVERLPQSADAPGCGYGVYVPEHTDEAERILRSAGIPEAGRRERVRGG